MRKRNLARSRGMLRIDLVLSSFLFAEWHAQNPYSPTTVLSIRRNYRRFRRWSLSQLTRQGLRNIRHPITSLVVSSHLISHRSCTTHPSSKTNWRHIMDLFVIKGLIYGLSNLPTFGGVKFIMYFVIRNFSISLTVSSNIFFSYPNPTFPCANFLIQPMFVSSTSHMWTNFHLG